MAQGVSFGQRVLYQPGAYTRVDGSQLTQLGGIAFGRVLCIGQALGGKPFEGRLFQDAAEALRYYGLSSPLGQAIALAFQGGVAGGATEVMGIRCDNAGIARGVAAASNGVTLAAEFKDYGGYGNLFRVVIEPGTIQGAKVSVVGTGLDGRPYRRVFDNRMSLSGVAKEVSQHTPVKLTVTAGGVAASQTLTLATNQVDGRATLNSVADITTSAYLYQYPARFVNNPAGSLIASFVGAISHNITGITSNTLQATGHTFVNGQRIRFTATTFPTGLNGDDFYYVINSSASGFQVAATPGGTALSVSGSFSDLVAYLFPNSLTVSNSTPTELNGSFAVHKPLPAMAVNVNAAISRTVYGAAIYRFTLAANNWPSDCVPGRMFQIASGTYAGLYQILMEEYDETGLNRIRVVRRLSSGSNLPEGVYNGNLSFLAGFRLTRNQPTDEPLETLLPGNGVLLRGAQYLTVTVNGQSFYYTTKELDTIEGIGQWIASQINASEALQTVAIAQAAYNATTFTSTVTISAVQPGREGNKIPVSIVVNPQPYLLVNSNGSTLAGGIDPPLPVNSNGQVGLNIVLTGGYDSMPTIADYRKALEIASQLSVYWIVPVTDDLAVQLAVAEHCQVMSENRRERRAIFGHDLGWSAAAVRERAEMFNSARVVFVSPGFRAPDFAGNGLRWYPAYLLAAKIAGMAVAEGIADPITHTYLTGITQLEINYQSGSVELDQMIQSGVLCVEADPAIGRPSRGFRVVRAITTLRTNSLMEGMTILTQSDYCAQRIRDRQETLFIGRAITPGIFDQIRYETNRELLTIKNLGAIYNFDPTRTVVRLNPELQSAIDVSYVIYPAPGLEFILNTQLLLPIPSTESAA